MLARAAGRRRAAPSRRSSRTRRAAAGAGHARVRITRTRCPRPCTARSSRARARTRRWHALLSTRAAASVTRLPIFLIFACELLELGRGMARLERIVSLIVVSHTPSISAMPRGAPTSTAPPHQNRRRASKLLSRIREVVDNKGRYVCLSKAKEEICELAPRVSQVRNFNIKFSECNSSHIGDFCPRRVNFEIREERDQDDFQATDAMRPFSQRRRRRTRRTKTRPHR